MPLVDQIDTDNPLRTTHVPRTATNIHANTMLKLAVLISLAISAAFAENQFLNDCHKSIYKCCSDGKTESMGHNMEGCGVAMCKDLQTRAFCRKAKRKRWCNKGRYGDTDYGTASLMTRVCAKTCDRCKKAAPQICLMSEFGCCWDSSTATGPDKTPGIGCPNCRDSMRTRSYCRRHKFQCSSSKGPRTRKFLREYCQYSCKIC